MKVEHLIVDTNGFVKNLPLHELGDTIYTTREVIGEIRDSATKQRLECLPYQLNFKEPYPEYIKLVTKLSKSTGDYASLSAVDIQLIALAYQITKEQLGPEEAAAKLKTDLDLLEGVKKVTVIGAGQKKVEEEDEDKDKGVVEEEKDKDEDTDEEDNEEEEEEEEDDDEEGWITPSNYKSKIKELQEQGGEFGDPEEPVKVACLTNDFSMQNLMLHIGIKVISSSGLLIRQLRTYILRCYTCFQTTSKMEKIFCPKCGNKTLKRVAVTVNPEDGTQVIHLSKRVNLTGRGKKYSLPMPKGGKHSNNPILSEDQPLPQQRPTKAAMKKMNPLDFEYVAGNSPFVTRDLYSRAAMLGINYGGKNYWEKKNPNEPRKSTGTRRKKNAA